MWCKYHIVFLLQCLAVLSLLVTIEATPLANEDLEDLDSEIEQDYEDETRTYCNMGWTAFVESGDREDRFKYCIKAFFNAPLRWPQAEEVCQNFNGGHLISITNDRDFEVIDRAILSEKTHRFVTQDKLGVWVGLAQLCPNLDPSTRPDFRWTDGEEFDNSNGDKIAGSVLRSPKIKEWSNHYCVSYNYEYGINERGKNEWMHYFNVTECNKRRGFVCKIRAVTKEERDRAEVSGRPEYSRKDEDSSVNRIDESANEMTEKYPCGKDPFYCHLKSEKGDTKCYHLLHKNHFWKQAWQSCEAEYQSDLVSIHSKDEADFIYQMTMMQPSQSGKTLYWIGLHRRNSQRQYEWSDGSPLNYMEQRSSDKHDNEGNEHGSCTAFKENGSWWAYLRSSGVPLRLAIKYSAFDPTNVSTPAYSWMHQRCDMRRPAICQKPGYGLKLTSLMTRKETQKELVNLWKCPKGFQVFRGMCYGVFGTKHDGGETFHSANKSCESMNAHLVSLTDPYEQGFVLSQLHGLNSDAWIGMDMMDGRVRWIDAEPVQMTRFNPDTRIFRIGDGRHYFQGNKFTGFSYDACVSLDATKMVGYWDLISNSTEPDGKNEEKDGKSKDKDGKPEEKPSEVTPQCTSKKLPYVCEKYAESAKESRPVNPCYTNGDIAYCFLSSTDDPFRDHDYYRGYEQGEKICTSLPKKEEYKFLQSGFGQLAQADDQFEWALLTSIAWQLGYDEFFMGIKLDQENGFQRSDDVRIRLAPWGEGEPNLRNGNCVATRLLKEGPAWFMAPCTRRKPLICRLSKEKPMAEIEAEVRCPQGKEDWVLGQTHCYHLVTNATSLLANGYKADHDCFRLFHADLATFETKEDLNRFKEQIINDKLSFSSAFIGLVRQDKDNFAWKDLSPVTFMNWDGGEPSDLAVRGLGHEEGCVAMMLNKEASWRTVSCMQGMHFICSVPAVGKYAKDDDVESHGNKGDENDVPDLPPPEEEEDVEKDKKSEKEDDKKTDKDVDKTNDKPEKTADKPEKTADNINPKEKAEKNKETTNDKDDAGSRSSAGGGMSTGSIIAVVIGVLLVVAVVGVVIQRRRHRKQVQNQQIMRFDVLQDEDEFGGL